jgi:hypothetical protein
VCVYKYVIELLRRTMLLSGAAYACAGFLFLPDDDVASFPLFVAGGIAAVHAAGLQRRHLRLLCLLGFVSLAAAVRLPHHFALQEYRWNRKWGDEIVFSLGAFAFWAAWMTVLYARSTTRTFARCATTGCATLCVTATVSAAWGSG